MTLADIIRKDLFNAEGSIDISDLGFNGLPSHNPILNRIDTDKATYLFYDALEKYLRGYQRRRYITPQNIDAETEYAILQRHYDAAEKTSASQYCEQFEFMDDITTRFRHRQARKQYPLKIESEERATFLKHPYLVAVKNGRVLGGIWQEDLHIIKKIKRLRKFHIFVSKDERGNGLGSELLSIFEEYVKSKDEDGLRCYFKDDNGHQGTREFFESKGYSINAKSDMIEAIKYF